MNENQFVIKDNQSLPLVSILIPTYNRPNYLKQALDSALNQTYSNTEIIICDNSEGDETSLLMKEYLTKHKNIRYYKNEKNLKYIGNMRQCLELAKGEYINYLMDDDLYAPTKIEKMMKFFLTDPDMNLVSSPRIIINELGEVIEPKIMGFAINGDWIGEGKYLIKLLISSLTNFLGEPTTVLFKKSAVKFEFGNYYNYDFLIISDLVFWLSIMETGKAAYLNEPLSYFRRHVQQTTASDEKEWGSVTPGFLEVAQLSNVAANCSFFSSKRDYTYLVINVLGSYANTLKDLVDKKGEKMEIPTEFADLITNLLLKL